MRTMYVKLGNNVPVHRNGSTQFSPCHHHQKTLNGKPACLGDVLYLFNVQASPSYQCAHWRGSALSSFGHECPPPLTPAGPAIWGMSWEPLIWPLGGLILRALGTSGRISSRGPPRSPGWGGGGSSSAPALNSPDLLGKGVGRSGVHGGDQQSGDRYPGGSGRLESEVWPVGPWPRASLSPGGAEEPGRAAGGELAGAGGARSQGGQRPGAERRSAGPTREQVEEAEGASPSFPLPATTSRCRHCPAKAAGASVLRGSSFPPSPAPPELDLVLQR